MPKARITAAFALTLAAVCATAAGANPSLTIYNQNFGVVRDIVHLDLQAGVNKVVLPDITSTLEPDSVILRDPAHKRDFQILEQNYRNDPITQSKLLSLFEGQTIDFQVEHADGEPTIVRGKVVRSGYVPPGFATVNNGDDGENEDGQYGGDNQGEPIIEVDGKLQFALPGLPLFPKLPDDTVLTPTLYTLLRAPQAGPLEAEIGYVAGGFSWQAAYNLVMPPDSDSMSAIGWITMTNNSGKTFNNASIKLIAGNVNKVQNSRVYAKMALSEDAADDEKAPPVVTQKSFDEYHMYTLANATTLHDKETKQVEFIHANAVHAARVYVYDGHSDGYDYGRYGYSYNSPYTDAGYYDGGNKKIWVLREFANSTANGLGMPLPAGRLRFYRQDSDGSLQFVGENTIEHTPKDEVVRVYTGDSFDLVGQHKRTDFKIDDHLGTIDESFEIRLRNHKDQSVTIRDVEHLQRWSNWKISQSSDPSLKMDASTVEFRVPVKANSEKVITYTVHYSWQPEK